MSEKQEAKSSGIDVSFDNSNHDVVCYVAYKIFKNQSDAAIDKLVKLGYDKVQSVLIVDDIKKHIKEFSFSESSHHQRLQCDCGKFYLRWVADEDYRNIMECCPNCGRDITKFMLVSGISVTVTRNIKKRFFGYRQIKVGLGFDPTEHKQVDFWEQKHLRIGGKRETEN